MRRHRNAPLASRSGKSEIQPGRDAAGLSPIRNGARSDPGNPRDGSVAAHRVDELGRIHASNIFMPREGCQPALHVNSRGRLRRAESPMAVYDPTERSNAAIARRLIATRQALGYTQAQLCRRTGVSPSAYNQYEKARNRPDWE